MFVSFFGVDCSLFCQCLLINNGFFQKKKKEKTIGLGVSVAKISFELFISV